MKFTFLLIIILLINMEKYRAYIGEKAIIPISINFDDKKSLKEKTIELNEAIKISNDKNLPFILFGIDKKVQKYIKTRAVYILNPEINKFKRMVAVVPNPLAGFIIDLYNKKDLRNKEWYEQAGVSIMTIEQAVLYQKFFPEAQFNISVKLDGIELVSYIDTIKS